MPQILYVGLQDDDRVAVYAIAENGELTKKADVPLPGGPSAFAVSNDQKTLYVGSRSQPAIASYRIDAASGGLTLLGSASVADAPTFLAPDRTGKYMLVAFYQGGYAAVHALAADGTVGAQVDKHETAIGAHAIATDRSNRYSFVPHIAFVQDNVLEPPKNIPGPNFIAQFKFDASNGKLAANSPARLELSERVGPRHYTFHPSLDIVYFSNEQGCSVTAYKLDAGTGTLSSVQTISTLPAGFTARNTCSQIHLTPSARFLYVGNRGHNSIAGFAVDAANGHLTPAGHAPTEAVPSAFCLDPAGRFLFAGGSATGKLASYRIDGSSGALTPLQTYDVGKRPQAVMAVSL